MDLNTLPDYLEEGLDLVLVGLNPSTYSVRVGHYFGNPRNRFWPAFYRSGLMDAQLIPELDYTLPAFGIGLTDVVKRPTSQGSGLNAADYRRWAPVLKEKLERYRPRVVSFHGTTAYRQYLAYGEGVKARPDLGLQERPIGESVVFVTPNLSPANARYSLDDLAGWYARLKALLPTQGIAL